MITKNKLALLLCATALHCTNNAQAVENGLMPMGTGDTFSSAGAGGYAGARGIEANGAIYHNPATLIQVNNMISGSAGNEFLDVSIDTSKAPVGPSGTVGNSAGKLNNRDRNIPFGWLGGSYQYNDMVTLGFTVYGAVTKVRYKQSPVNPMLLAAVNPGLDSAPHTSFNSLAVLASPAVAFRPMESHSYGIALIGGVTQTKTNLANSKLIATQGKKRETRYGTGFSLGGAWDLGDQFSVGASYTSPIRFQKSKTYKDILPHRQNMPAMYGAGLTYHLSQDTDLMFDVKQMMNRSEKLLKSFKWRNQTIYMLGLSHQFNDEWRVRAGYNYGRSAIRSDGVVYNIFSPKMLEHHYAIGVGCSPNPNSEFGLTATYGVPKKIIAKGSNDDVTAKALDGSVFKLKRQSSLSVSYSYKF